MAARTGVVGAGYGGQPVAISVSPPPYVIRQQTGTSLPTAPARVIEALGGYSLGAALVSVLTGVLPTNEKLIGPVVGGGIGTVAALASPIGTWTQDIGAGAMTSGAFVLFLKFTNQMPGVSQYGG